MATPIRLRRPAAIPPVALLALLAALSAASAFQDPPAERPGTAPAADPSAGRARLAEVHDYLSRDGGRWRAKNPAHGPGAPSPAQFCYEFDWVLDGSAVAARIFAVHEDGSERTLWRALTTWHPGEREVVIYSVSADGDISSGTYEVIDDAHHRLHLTLTAPSGESFQVRDDLEIVGPDRFLSTTSMLRGEEWVEIEGQDWRRVPSGGA